MNPAGPQFESRGSVQGYNVIQGVKTGNNTIFNFQDSWKGASAQNEKEGLYALTRPIILYTSRDLTSHSLSPHPRLFRDPLARAGHQRPCRTHVRVAVQYRRIREMALSNRSGNQQRSALHQRKAGRRQVDVDEAYAGALQEHLP
jgi:hypothetical protein